MTEDEARTKAIKAGALKPQGLKERMAAGILAHNQTNPWAWRSTPRAQQRLTEWTEAIESGVDPGQLKK
jgi:hypothetical protein